MPAILSIVPFSLCPCRPFMMILSRPPAMYVDIPHMRGVWILPDLAAGSLNLEV